MKTLLLVVVAFVLGSLAPAAVAQVRQAQALSTPDQFLTDSAIYFRDASGRCLRLQLQPLETGRLAVHVMATRVCTP